ncbi:MAG: hypothetical protein ACI3XA_09380 [Clostridia bacterium]
MKKGYEFVRVSDLICKKTTQLTIQGGSTRLPLEEKLSALLTDEVSKKEAVKKSLKK